MTYSRFVKGLAVLAFIGLVVIVFGVASDMRDKEARSKLDNRLDTFNVAKQTAFEVEKLILMDNQEEYEKQAQYFKRILDDNVYNEYFPTDTYGGGDKNIELERVSMRGSIDTSRDFTFKYEALIIEGKTETPLSLLVFIKGNKIIRIKSLG